MDRLSCYGRLSCCMYRLPVPRLRRTTSCSRRQRCAGGGYRHLDRPRPLFQDPVQFADAGLGFRAGPLRDLSPNRGCFRVAVKPSAGPGDDTYRLGAITAKPGNGSGVTADGDVAVRVGAHKRIAGARHDHLYLQPIVELYSATAASIFDITGSEGRFGFNVQMRADLRRHFPVLNLNLGNAERKGKEQMTKKLMAGKFNLLTCRNSDLWNALRKLPTVTPSLRTRSACARARRRQQSPMVAGTARLGRQAGGDRRNGSEVSRESEFSSNPSRSSL